jgi:hypothetical protein
MKMDTKQKIEHLFAGQAGMKAKVRADVKVWYEMRDREEAEGKAYMYKMFAKLKEYREEIATRRVAIHGNIDDKLRAEWRKLDAVLKKGRQTY